MLPNSISDVIGRTGDNAKNALTGIWNSGDSAKTVFDVPGLFAGSVLKESGGFLTKTAFNVAGLGVEKIKNTVLTLGKFGIQLLLATVKLPIPAGSDGKQMTLANAVNRVIKIPDALEIAARGTMDYKDAYKMLTNAQSPANAATPQPPRPTDRTGDNRGRAGTETKSPDPQPLP